MDVAICAYKLRMKKAALQKKTTILDYNTFKKTQKFGFFNFSFNSSILDFSHVNKVFNNIQIYYNRSGHRILPTQQPPTTTITSLF